MSCIPQNIDWQKLALAFGTAKIKPDTLKDYNIPKDTLYRLRKGIQSDPSWSLCSRLWDAANDRLSEEEIEGCAK